MEKLNDINKSDTSKLKWNISNYNNKEDSILFLNKECNIEEYMVNYEEKVEFKLLNQIITDGKISFNEAVILLIKERANLLRETEFKNYYNTLNCSNNSIDLENSIIIGNNSQYKSAKSLALSTKNLIKRIDIKLKKYQNINDSEDFPSKIFTKEEKFLKNIEERRQRLKEKHLKQRLRYEAIKNDKKN